MEQFAEFFSRVVIEHYFGSVTRPSNVDVAPLRGPYARARARRVEQVVERPRADRVNPTTDDRGGARRGGDAIALDCYSEAPTL